MKTSLLVPILGLFPIAMAERCAYKLYGSIVNDPIIGWSWSGHLDDGVGIYDYGILCGQGSGNNDGGQDEDGNWKIGCQDGFDLTLSQTGSHATFVNGALTDEWNTGATADFYDCYGACQDKGGACIQCTQYDFTSEAVCDDLE